MGIWESIFGWKAFFRWDALAVVIPGVFLAIGLALLGVDWFPHNLLISQICLAIVGLLCIVKFIGHSVESKGAVSGRIAFAVLISAFILSICIWSVFAIQEHKSAVSAKTTPAQLIPEKQSVAHSTIPHSASDQPARKNPNKAKLPAPNISIHGGLIQTTNAPCSGNSVTGNVDNSNCTIGYVPPPQRVIQQSPRNAAVDKLRTTTSSATVYFVVIGVGQEVNNFEGALEKIFTDGGWKIIGRSYIGQAVFVQAGNEGVQRSSGEGFNCLSSSASGKIALKALEIAGYPCGSGSVASHGAQADIVIQVGTRIPSQD